MDAKDRIKIIIENEGLSQVEFSTRTGIKTSTLSHVLTGRNNASPDVIAKVLSAFPKYEANWLINGDGPMVHASIRSEEARERMIPLFQDQLDPVSPSVGLNGFENFSTVGMAPQGHQRRIEKIIVYYDDSTYEVLLPSDQAVGK